MRSCPPASDRVLPCPTDACPEGRGINAQRKFFPSGNSADSTEGSNGATAVAAALAWLDEATDGATKLRVPLRIEVVRPLIAADLADHPAPPPPSLREIKASHHALAKLVAEGRSNADASCITGYSPEYIARLRKDTAFAELVTHYSEVCEIAATDFLGAMRGVGMDLLAELRKRVEDSPESLSVGQLQEGIKLLLVEPMKSEALRGGLASGVAAGTLRVTFVASDTPQASAKVIEGEVVRP